MHCTFMVIDVYVVKISHTKILFEQYQRNVNTSQTHFKKNTKEFSVQMNLKNIKCI